MLGNHLSFSLSIPIPSRLSHRHITVPPENQVIRFRKLSRYVTCAINLTDFNVLYLVVNIHCGVRPSPTLHLLPSFANPPLILTRTDRTGMETVQSISENNRRVSIEEVFGRYNRQQPFLELEFGASCLLVASALSSTPSSFYSTFRCTSLSVLLSQYLFWQQKFVQQRKTAVDVFMTAAGACGHPCRAIFHHLGRQSGRLFFS